MSFLSDLGSEPHDGKVERTYTSTSQILIGGMATFPQGGGVNADVSFSNALATKVDIKNIAMYPHFGSHTVALQGCCDQCLDRCCAWSLCCAKLPVIERSGPCDVDWEYRFNNLGTSEGARSVFQPDHYWVWRIDALEATEKQLYIPYNGTLWFPFRTNLDTAYKRVSKRSDCATRFGFVKWGKEQAVPHPNALVQDFLIGVPQLYNPPPPPSSSKGSPPPSSSKGPPPPSFPSGAVVATTLVSAASLEESATAAATEAVTLARGTHLGERVATVTGAGTGIAPAAAPGVAGETTPTGAPPSRPELTPGMAHEFYLFEDGREVSGRLKGDVKEGVQSLKRDLAQSAQLLAKLLNSQIIPIQITPEQSKEIQKLLGLTMLYGSLPTITASVEPLLRLINHQQNALRALSSRRHTSMPIQDSAVTSVPIEGSTRTNNARATTQTVPQESLTTDDILNLREIIGIWLR